MQKVTINQTDYTFITNFKDDEQIRASFNKLAENTFDFNFESFYQNGYWNERYVPYALLDGSKVVANASVNILDFLVMGEKKRYIQIGTVMTHSDYRNRGLSRFLLENIIAEWQNQSNVIYLFANNTVLDFYPKFGFCRKSEYQCTKQIHSDKSKISAVQLDMSLTKNRDMLFSLTENTRCFSALCATHNTALVMFYATSFMSENFYYLKEQNAVVMASYEGETLHLDDIFCLHEISVCDIINAMADKSVTRVVLGFTPKDPSYYTQELFPAENDTLFIKTKEEIIFDSNKLMFPILSHA